MYLAVNVIFAGLYTGASDQVHCVRPKRTVGLSAFSQAFFFSVHTLTTVGYGDLYPLGLAANIVAAVEAADGADGIRPGCWSVVRAVLSPQRPAGFQ